MRRQLYCLFAAMLLSIDCTISAAASLLYHLTDINPVNSGQSTATAINDLGQVVGYSGTLSLRGTAFLYQDGQSTALSIEIGLSSYATGINNQGQISGYSHTVHPFTGAKGPPGAFIYQNGAPLYLGSLPNGNQSYAYSLNESGQVVGKGRAGVVAQHAFLYDGQMIDLGTLGANNSWGNDINNFGTVVGAAGIAGGLFHAFRYDNGVMTDLGKLGGHSSEAYAINDDGLIVGSTGVAGYSANHAFLYDGSAMHDLGTLGGGYSDFSVAYDINQFGRIVGMSESPDSTYTRGFLYRDGVMHDLNKLLDESGAGWTLIEANSINSLDWIVGKAQTPDGSFHAVLLTPVPEPHSLTLGLLAFLGVAARCRSGRVVAHSKLTRVGWWPNSSPCT